MWDMWLAISEVNVFLKPILYPNILYTQIKRHYNFQDFQLGGTEMDSRTLMLGSISYYNDLLSRNDKLTIIYYSK